MSRSLQHPFQLYYRDDKKRRNLFLPVFTKKTRISSLEEFERIVQRDNTTFRFEKKFYESRNTRVFGYYRKKENFRSTDCLHLEIDNDESPIPSDPFRHEKWDDPSNWLDFEGVCRFLPNVEILAATSRSHNKTKNGRAPRPKIHLYLPLGRSIDALQTQLAYHKLNQIFTGETGEKYLDQAVGPTLASFLSGSEEREIFYQPGQSVLKFLECVETKFETKTTDLVHTKKNISKVFSKETSLTKTITRFLLDSPAFFRRSAKTINLKSGREKTPGGYYVFVDDPFYVLHPSKPAEKILDWFSRYYPSLRDSVRDILDDSSNYIHDFFQDFQYDQTLEIDEFCSEAIESGEIDFSKSEIQLIVSETGTGKGKIQESLVENSDLSACVDPLIRLTRQTVERLQTNSTKHVEHYSDVDPLMAVTQAECLVICTPSLSESKMTWRYFSHSREDLDFTVVLDEFHTLADSLFKNDQLYFDFVFALRDRVEKMICLTATPTYICDIVLNRLKKDLNLPVRKVKINKKRQNKKPATACFYETKEQKTDFIVTKIQEARRENRGKIVIIDQSREYIETTLAPVLSKSLKDSGLNVVTSRSREEYNQEEMTLTLASPSLSQGYSLDQKVGLFIVNFNDAVATPESFEQNLNRVRNHHGLNENCQIFALAKSRPGPVENPVSLRRLIVEKQNEALNDLKEINNVFHNIPERTKLVKKINSLGKFLTFRGQLHEYDQDYLSIVSYRRAARSFMLKFGSARFLKFFHRNPQCLGGVKIVETRDLTDPDPERIMFYDKMRQEIESQEKLAIQNASPILSYQAKEQIINQLEKDADHLNDLHSTRFKLLKFNAARNNVETQGKTSKTIKREISKNTNFSVINTLFFLWFFNLEKLSRTHSRLFLDLKVGREKGVFLFRLARRIFNLAKKYEKNELAEKILKLLSSLDKKEKELFFGEGKKSIRRAQTKIMSMLGYHNHKKTKRNAAKVKVRTKREFSQEDHWICEDSNPLINTNNNLQKSHFERISLSRGFEYYILFQSLSEYPILIDEIKSADISNIPKLEKIILQKRLLEHVSISRKAA